MSWIWSGIQSTRSLLGIFVFFTLVIPCFSPVKSGDDNYSGLERVSGHRTDFDVAMHLLLIIFLVLFGGILSGLTIGLMTLDETHLTILQRSGTEEERVYASMILPIRRNGYLLLCTLLVANSIVNETLPIIIDRLDGTGWQAVVISTLLLLLFAEILPQAFFTKFGLMAGARLIWLVKVLIVMFYPISYPLSLFVHRVIGHNSGITYKRSELKELVTMLTGSQLMQEEVDIMSGVLDFTGKTPFQIMVPLSEVFMLEINTLINKDTIDEIIFKGYSRIPLYEGTRFNIVSILLTKHFISSQSIVGRRLSDLKRLDVKFTSFSTSLFEVLESMKGGRSGHLTIVIDGNNTPLGIVTLEDIIEELLQQEIIDETDEYIDVTNKIRVPHKLLTTQKMTSNYLATKLSVANTLQNTYGDGTIHVNPFYKEDLEHPKPQA